MKLYRYLCEEKKEYVLSKQILRSGTSIGANVEEAVGGHSEKDFGAKIGIAYKEALETHYWLRLLRDSGYLDAKQAKSIMSNCEELSKILGAIQMTIRKKIMINFKSFSLILIITSSGSIVRFFSRIFPVINRDS